MKGHNPTLRVINILEALMQDSDGLTLTEIARKCKMPKGSVSPIIHTLANNKLLKHDSLTRKYSIGIRCYEIGSQYLLQINVLEEIREITKQVVNKCKETCHFAVLDKAHIVYLIKQDSLETIRMVSSIGKRIPAYSTAIGKALLSGLTDKEVGELYPEGLKEIMPKTIVDINVLYEQLAQVRINKIAFETEESSKNVTCIAVTIEKEGRVVAALSVSIPVFRATVDNKKQIKEVLFDAKDKIDKLIRTVPFNF